MKKVAKTLVAIARLKVRLHKKNALRCVALRCRAAPHVDACCKLMLMYAKYMQEEILMSNSIKFHIPHFLDVFFIVHYNVISHVILELDTSITRNPTLQ